MNYYELLVGDPYFHGTDALTYSSREKITPNKLVLVPLRSRQRLAIVVKKVAKPKFEAKEIQIVFDLIMPPQTLEFLEWLRSYYPGPLGSITQLYLPPGNLNVKTLEKASKITANGFKTSKMPALTSEQHLIIKNISTSSERSFLLHGDTGTGKTRIYTELAGQSLRLGKSALILTPEIGLTSQLEDSFKEVYGDRVLLYHSNLTPAQRRTVWLKIAQTDSALVLIGPRSALFAPFKNLGLIVVDEAHETAYKQENTPFYYTPRVAAKLANLHNAQLIFGTATPLISEYYYAQKKNIPVLRMVDQPVKQHSQKTDVQVVQIRDRTLFTKDAYLSDALLDATKTALDKGEQSLIFLNRRGSARIVLCQNCGWRALCPTCDLPLIYHGDSHTLRCHTCGYSQKPLNACPVCSGVDIVFRGIGTKSLEVRLAQLFPKAKIRRFDADNLKADRLENNLALVKSNSTDIIIGTQLLAKGLDIPNLSVVGVVAADSSLYLPDFTAEEKTYQLLSQIIGRVGRGHRPGKAIVQTYSPGSASIKAATENEWQKFYTQQLQERQKYLFPPFCHLLRIDCARKSRGSAEQAAQKLCIQIKALGKKIIVIGPTPAFHERRGANYHWQVVIKSKNRQDLLDITQQLPNSTIFDLDPANLL